MIYRLLRPLLFSLDPEWAHTAVMRMLPVAEVMARHLPKTPPLQAESLAQDLWGLHFPNPVGLAGGFDKSAVAPHVWPLLGFGFAELGTITAEAQPGNPRPRIFRLPRDRALINRLGFNNDGAAAVAARLQRGGWHRPAIPIGINLGKSQVTPVAEAAADYARSLALLFPVADYVAVNVSSPNTPGLRELQDEAQLRQLLAHLQEANAALSRQHATVPRPLLVKIAPDLDDAAVAAAVAVAVDAGAAGIIATNTTLSREGLQQRNAEAGGLSGAPLRRRSTEVIRLVYRATRGEMPIVGVGGIFGAEDAYEKIRAGASLLQVYTGLIYEGPLLARSIVRGLRRLLARDGFAHLREAIGVSAGR